MLASCRDDSSAADSRLNSFSYNEPDGIGSLDPAVASYQAAIWATGHLFNGLVELDSNLAIQPCIAKSWDVNADGTEWTFHIRKVLFHDNVVFGKNRTRSVTASDVQYSIERICDARTKSTGLWAFRNKIVGVDDFHRQTKESPESAEHIKGIVVKDDSTIIFKLEKPFAPFLAVLSMPYGYIVPKEAVEHYGSDFGQHPVGTGAFAFYHWTQDIELVAKRNPAYFKKDEQGSPLPYLEEVRITFLRDIKNEFLEFTRGQYDIVSSIDGTFAPSVYEVDGTLKEPYTEFVMHRAASQSVEYYGFLLDTTFAAAKAVPLASNKKLRQAMNYAIDRHRIVTYVLNGRGIPARHGVLPPTMPGFNPEVKGYGYDVEKARTLLAEAGFPNGKGCPQLLLQLGNNARTASVAEAIQEMWREIGLNVELQQVDFPQHLAQVRQGGLAMWRTSWIGDYPDPENFLALFISENQAPAGPNTTHLVTEELDALYSRALSPNLSASERGSLYNEMEEIIIDEAPWIFLYHDVLMRLTQPNVHGFHLDGSGRLLLERVFKSSGT